MEKKINPRTQRIDCITRIRSARIMLDGYEVGIISEETNDAGEFDWVIRPNYENIAKVRPFMFPGINLDLHKEEYIRRYVPVFVTQRTLPDNRDRLYEQLAEYGLTWNDRFEYMCRNHGLCGNNDMTVERIGEAEVNEELEKLNAMNVKNITERVERDGNSLPDWDASLF